MALALIGTRAVDFDYQGIAVRFHPSGNTAEKRALLNPARFDPQEHAFIKNNLVGSEKLVSRFWLDRR